MDHRLTSSNLSAASLGLHLSTASPAPSHSSVSTPVSACSPDATSPGASNFTNVPQIAIRPNAPAGKQPAIRMSATSPASMASVDSPSAAGPLTMTTKEWVIPPRPKPGRKPATDTPPTKRKAQNRAAQRAFRERRAARVGELEEQLDEQKEEHDKVVQELQERISHLEIEAQTLMSRCQWLEGMLEKERLERNEAPKNDRMSTDTQLHPRPPSAHNDLIAPRTIVPVSPAAIPEPQSMAQPFSISQIVSPPAEPSDMPQNFSCGACQSTGPCICAEQALQDTEMPFGCGGCTTTSRCACLEESIQASINADLKRPRAASPGAESNEKRHRTDSGLALEMDFTHMFAQSPENNRQPAPSAVLPQPSIEIRESCGFCKDGSYCVCADTMMATVNIPSLQQRAAHQTQTPPCEDDVVPVPMEVTATGAIKLPHPRPNRSSQRAAPPTAKPTGGGGCGPNGPGTCSQCLTDPVSGLFCRSLAANFERTSRQQPNGQPAGGCCGKGGPGACCKTGGEADVNKSPVPSATLPAPSPSAGFGLSLSCADAYKTLASHRHFNEATDDIGSWLPKLRAVPVPPSRPGLPAPGNGGVFQGRGHLTAGRAPIEVEAASIMSVLKGFDVRFGRGE
ncbi:hypothetical protein B0T18DRAFT_79766 [Schizothecium vesticola]|uniref:BZIP domain-containing protein n=1 Tax=Schizothecium vesticola TaxID=314040 RepID=A0AA40KAA3_9PEZI|nr:hypothetical protein B0T18DRAFT_79766 [Schizothecium vesticola]